MAKIWNVEIRFNPNGGKRKKIVWMQDGVQQVKFVGSMTAAAKFANALQVRAIDNNN